MDSVQNWTPPPDVDSSIRSAIAKKIRLFDAHRALYSPEDIYQEIIPKIAAAVPKYQFGRGATLATFAYQVAWRRTIDISRRLNRHAASKDLPLLDLRSDYASREKEDLTTLPEKLERVYLAAKRRFPSPPPKAGSRKWSTTAHVAAVLWLMHNQALSMRGVARFLRARADLRAIMSMPRVSDYWVFDAVKIQSAFLDNLEKSPISRPADN